jgi:pimeloyl-ACP methyl ester carboxylesterase
LNQDRHGFTSPQGGWARLMLALAVRASVRPRLAFDLLSAAWSFRRRGWLGRPPFLPLPSPEYLRWRMYTAYGDEHAVPPADDVIRFAQWRRKLLNL